MSKVKKKDLKKYVEKHGGELVRLKDGNYDIRRRDRSRNIGKPDSSGKWARSQLERAWGDATGIKKPDAGEL